MSDALPKIPCVKCGALNAHVTRQLVTYERYDRGTKFGHGEKPVEITTIYLCPDCGGSFIVKVDADQP
jgi:hypothetical protein